MWYCYSDMHSLHQISMFVDTHTAVMQQIQTAHFIQQHLVVVHASCTAMLTLPLSEQFTEGLLCYPQVDVNSMSYRR
jgi:hypothetical protein